MEVELIIYFALSLSLSLSRSWCDTESLVALYWFLFSTPQIKGVVDQLSYQIQTICHIIKLEEKHLVVILTLIS